MLVQSKVFNDKSVACLKCNYDNRAIIVQRKVDKSKTLDNREVSIGIQASREHLSESKQKPEANPFLFLVLLLGKTNHAANETAEERAKLEEAALSGTEVEHKEQDGNESHQNVANREGDLLLRLLDRLYLSKPKNNSYQQ